MYKTLFFILILLTFCLASSSALQLPKDVRLPNYTNYYDSSGVAAITRFFPIGWSKNGAFAFLTSSYSDATAKNEVTLFLLDLKTDSLLAYLSEELEPDETSAVAAFWKSNSDSISVVMKKFNVAMNHGPIAQFPYTLNQDKITVEVENVCISKEIVAGNFTKADTVKVVAHKGNLLKPIGSYVSTFLCGTVEVAGFLKSPFEERIAVVLTSWSPGWEGPPKTVSVMIRGCHLVNGFQSRK